MATAMVRISLKLCVGPWVWEEAGVAVRERRWPRLCRQKTWLRGWSGEGVGGAGAIFLMKLRI